MLPALTESARCCKHESGRDGVGVSTAAVGVEHAPLTGCPHGSFRHPTVLAARDRNGDEVCVRSSRLRRRDRMGLEGVRAATRSARAPARAGLRGDGATRASSTATGASSGRGGSVGCGSSRDARGCHRRSARTHRFDDGSSETVAKSVSRMYGSRGIAGTDTRILRESRCSPRATSSMRCVTSARTRSRELRRRPSC
jgi:hypothetical protein